MLVDSGQAAPGSCAWICVCSSVGSVDTMDDLGLRRLGRQVRVGVLRDRLDAAYLSACVSPLKCNISVSVVMLQNSFKNIQPIFSALASRPTAMTTKPRSPA